ncbi:DUF6627 family protein [Marinospirillum alkaliphilum]|uniref:PA2779 family protein n=1 Tax=Marinospirillum alkaliphilum DSM 21637 TaxID=1122209 RepID=A0A1K1UGL9_9GAMM|nr:DUF6627 family protein [Marinospirillum alkaliphilum]SFX11982.1 hypothetical protein SAMN02745752_00611 [Marinospirillum alkaliphilum DSM 21637]
MKFFFKTLAFVLISLLMLSPLQATMISNQQLLEQQQPSNKQSALTASTTASLTERQQTLQQQLVSLGVAPQLAEERISRLTPEEIALLEQQLDELPAGSGLLGAALIVFVLFVITDMLGATDIFPFVRSIND